MMRSPAQKYETTDEPLILILGLVLLDCSQPFMSAIYMTVLARNLVNRTG